MHLPLTREVVGVFVRFFRAAIKGALDKINLDPNLVDEITYRRLVASRYRRAPARQAAIYAGLPNTLLVPLK
jgi:acetyl-CoA C-acetyltransferase